MRRGRYPAGPESISVVFELCYGGVSEGPGSTRDQIVCCFGVGGPYFSYQHGKTRRIRFVTPTKLPYPWNLMS